MRCLPSLCCVLRYSFNKIFIESMLKSYLEKLYLFYNLYGELIYQSCVKSFSDNIHMEVMFKIIL